MTHDNAPVTNFLFADVSGRTGTISKVKELRSVVQTEEGTTAIGLLEAMNFDVVLICFDPCSEESVDELIAVCRAAKTQKIPAATISTFNTTWTDNLAAQYGAFRHFARFPSTAELSALAQTISEKEIAR